MLYTINIILDFGLFKNTFRQGCGTMAKTKLDELVAEDISKQKGVSIPVRAGLLERILVRKTACSNLHPNAEDEFSINTVGPSYRIINEYETKFREALRISYPERTPPLGSCNALRHQACSHQDNQLRNRVRHQDHPRKVSARQARGHRSR